MQVCFKIFASHATTLSGRLGYELGAQIPKSLFLEENFPQHRRSILGNLEWFTHNPQVLCQHPSVCVCVLCTQIVFGCFCVKAC